MNANLRPMNLGEILDRTFQIYRAKFLVFIGIAAIPALAYMALGLVLFILEQYGPSTTLSASSKVAFKEAASWLPNQWPYSFFLCLLWPMFVFLTSRIFLNEEAGIISSYSWCRAHWKSYLALASVLWVVWHLLPNVLNRIVINSEVAFSANHIFSGFGSSYSFSFYQFTFGLLRWLLEYLLIVMICFSVPSWTLEGLALRSALQRGLTFARGNWTRALVAWFLVNILEWILYITFIGIFFFTLRLVFGNLVGDFYYRIRFAILIPSAIAIHILIAPLFPIAVTLFYYDQRIRLEGFDIERMMKVAGLNASVTTPAETGEGQA